MSEEYKFIIEPESNHCTDSQTAKSEENLEIGAERKFKVRLYRWLCAARFFKTPELAQAAIASGAVFYNGEPSKPSREIELGAILQIRRGSIETTVIIKGLSTRRRSQEEALKLYEETEESKLAREQLESDAQETNFNQMGLDYATPSPYQSPQYGYKSHLHRDKRSGFSRKTPNSQNQSASYPHHARAGYQNNYYGNTRNPGAKFKPRTNQPQYGNYFQQEGQSHSPRFNPQRGQNQHYSKPAPKPLKFYTAPKIEANKPELRGPFIRRRNKKEIEPLE